MIYPIAPVPKPRMTQRDRWARRFCVERYYAFKDACCLVGMALPEGAGIVFHMPMPKSWTQKRRDEMRGTPHTQKPDIDNLLKAVLDSIYDDDSVVWHIGGLKKIWADDGAIEIGG